MMAEIDTQSPPDTERPPEPPTATPTDEAAPTRPSFLDALMRALGPIHT